MYILIHVGAGTSCGNIYRVAYPDLAIDVRAVSHADRINVSSLFFPLPFTALEAA